MKVIYMAYVIIIWNNFIALVVVKNNFSKKDYLKLLLLPKLKTSVFISLEVYTTFDIRPKKLGGTLPDEIRLEPHYKDAHLFEFSWPNEANR